MTTHSISSVFLLNALELDRANVEARPREKVAALAQRMVARHTLGAGLYDEVRLAAALRSALREGERTSVERGLLISHFLEALPAAVRAELALDYVFGCGPGQLEQVSAGGLMSLREACAQADAERGEWALGCVDAVLRRAAPKVVAARGLTIVAPDLSAVELRSVTRRVRSLEVGALLEGMVLIVRPRGEETTPASALLEHVRRSLDHAQRAELDKAIAEGSVLCVERERLLVAPAGLKQRVEATLVSLLTPAVAWLDARLQFGPRLARAHAGAQAR